MQEPEDAAPGENAEARHVARPDQHVDDPAAAIQALLLLFDIDTMEDGERVGSADDALARTQVGLFPENPLWAALTHLRSALQLRSDDASASLSHLKAANAVSSLVLHAETTRCPEVATAIALTAIHLRARWFPRSYGSLSELTAKTAMQDCLEELNTSRRAAREFRAFARDMVAELVENRHDDSDTGTEYSPAFVRSVRSLNDIVWAAAPADANVNTAGDSGGHPYVSVGDASECFFAPVSEMFDSLRRLSLSEMQCHGAQLRLSDVNHELLLTLTTKDHLLKWVVNLPMHEFLDTINKLKLPSSVPPLLPAPKNVDSMMGKLMGMVAEPDYDNVGKEYELWLASTLARADARKAYFTPLLALLSPVRSMEPPSATWRQMLNGTY